MRTSVRWGVRLPHQSYHPAGSRGGRSGGGLINVSNLNVAVPVNVCDNDILSGVLGVLSRDLTNNDR